MTMRVLLVDDQTLIRAALRVLVQAVPGVQVVAEAADGREALQLAEQHVPDVVLMDIAMAGMNGLEATSRLVKAFPKVHVVILSAHTSEDYVMQALRAGAAGYLPKDAGVSELEAALRAVERDETYLSPRVSRAVIDNLRRGETPGMPLDQLTPRQREILQLIAEGYSTKEIAQRLDLSVKTIETHRMQLMQRLDIHDVAGLVRYAIRSGMIHVHP